MEDEKPTARRNLARRQPPRGSYNRLKIPRSLSHPPTATIHLRAPPRRAAVSLAFVRTFPASFSSSLFGAAGGGAQLRLKTYDAVIFIAFRRLYAPLNFNARSPPGRISCSPRKREQERARVSLPSPSFPFL